MAPFPSDTSLDDDVNSLDTGPLDSVQRGTWVRIADAADGFVRSARFAAVEEDARRDHSCPAATSRAVYVDATSSIKAAHEPHEVVRCTS
jgi:hypothetical protein